MKAYLGSSPKDGVRGSTSYFVQEVLVQNKASAKAITQGSKAVVEHFSKGILLRGFKSNKVYLIAIQFTEIASVKLTYGAPFERILPLGPQWMLRKLGADPQLAKKFAIKHLERGFALPTLCIATSGLDMLLNFNPSLFRSQEAYWGAMPLEGKFTVHQPGSTN